MEIAYYVYAYDEYSALKKQSERDDDNNAESFL